MPGTLLNNPEIKIKENSWLAKLAALKLGTRSVAIVMGKTIHLYNTTQSAFLMDERWVKHELCHIRQFKEHGFIRFIVKYLWETIKSGYFNNRFEIQARQAEVL